MPLSIQSLRELNKFHLLAIGIPMPSGGGWDTSRWQDDQSAEASFSNGGNPWKVSIYCTEGFNMEGRITTTEPLGSIVNKALNNQIVSYGARLAGLAPQLDYAQKYLFSSVQPLEFTVSGSLVLESGLIEDYLDPLSKLAYLAFPDRGPVVSLSGLLEAVQNGLKQLNSNKVGGVVQWALDAVSNVTTNVGSIISMLSGGGASEEEGKDTWQGVLDSFNAITGKAYTMTPPPTLKTLKAGSGLDFKYGNVLISDVYIKSLNVKYPTLFYEGGFPAFIPVTMTLGTFRPITATAFRQMISGVAQSWSDPNVDKQWDEHIKETLKTVSL